MFRKQVKPGASLKPFQIKSLTPRKRTVGNNTFHQSVPGSSIHNSIGQSMTTFYHSSLCPLGPGSEFYPAFGDRTQFKLVMLPYYNWPFTILIAEKFALKLISSVGREGLSPNIPPLPSPQLLGLREEAGFELISI